MQRTFKKKVERKLVTYIKVEINQSTYTGRGLIRKRILAPIAGALGNALMSKIVSTIAGGIKRKTRKPRTTTKKACGAGIKKKRVVRRRKI